jgi:hypothetical protein
VASGVAELLARAQQELGGPLLGATFLYDARQMFAATREIEPAVSEPGTTLYVGSSGPRSSTARPASTAT